jgi:hypothetical protein
MFGRRRSEGGFSKAMSPCPSFPSGFGEFMTFAVSGESAFLSPSFWPA